MNQRTTTVIVAVSLVATLAALIAGIVVGYLGFSRPQHPISWEEELVRKAEALAATYERPVEVKPYRLSARVGKGWSCEEYEETKKTHCQGGLWDARWSIDPETRPGSVAALVAVAAAPYPKEPDNVDFPGLPDVLGRRTLAGFSGVLRHREVAREQSNGFEFEGWRESGGKTLVLRASSYAQRGARVEDADGKTQLDGLAVLLTTTGTASVP